jgi:CdiA C-terminal tRNase domain
LLIVGVGSAIVLAGPVVAVGGLVGAFAGGYGGGWLGGKVFGEGSDGQKWSAIAGSFLGGYLGAKVAPRAWQGAKQAWTKGTSETPRISGGATEGVTKTSDSVAAQDQPLSSATTRMNEVGPTSITARDPVSLAAQRRLNGIDQDRNTLAPGEAGAAAEMENYLGGTLERAPGGTSADYVVQSGEYAGARIDFKLTPDTFEQAAKINTYFDKTFPKFSQSIADKLAKPDGVDMMPFDTRFLSAANKQKLFDFISTLPKSSQKKVIFLE